jgi:parallel beta-helix repeat protein
MSKKAVSGMMLTLLLMGMFTLTFNILPVKTVASTIVVPDDYPTIQEAINNADGGDTIFVRAGTYSDNVVVNKTVSLIGEDRDTTFIEEQEGVIIEANNVTIREFTIRNGKFNIWLKSSYCLISDNNMMSACLEGIFLDGRDANVTYNVVINNCIANNDDCGIVIWNAHQNEIRNNKIVENYFGIFVFWYSSRNVIKSNEVSDNSDIGVVIKDWSSCNVILGNNISNNGWGGDMEMCAISLVMYSSSNQIILNHIEDNKRGIVQRLSSNNNTIYHNSFINNAIQVYCGKKFPCVNAWDNGYPSGGNYWSDYNGNDTYSGSHQNETGSDGIGDTPYVIDKNNQDNYPLMNPCVPPVGDINYDGEVDMQDIYIVIQAFGSYPGQPRWNPSADIDKDDRISMGDIYLVIINFGKTCSLY